MKTVLAIPLFFLCLLVYGRGNHAAVAGHCRDRAVHCRAWKNAFLGHPAAGQHPGLARFMADENFALPGGRYDSTVYRPAVFGRKKSFETFYFRADDGTKITGWIHMLRTSPAKRMLRIKGLAPGSRYMVKWYDTATGEPDGLSQEMPVDKNGELAVEWRPGLRQKQACGDAAFKIVRFSR